MYSNHSILVNTTYAANAADKNLSEMTKEEIKEMVINYATEETERFYGPVFDSRSLDDDQPVIFADDNWSLFEEILLAVDRDQKNYAKHMLDYLKEEVGSTDVSEILSSLLLANDRTANREDVDSNTWRLGFLAQQERYMSLSSHKHHQRDSVFVLFRKVPHHHICVGSPICSDSNRSGYIAS